jgi:hypothetical protein
MRFVTEIATLLSAGLNHMGSCRVRVRLLLRSIAVSALALTLCAGTLAGCSRSAYECDDGARVSTSSSNPGVVQVAPSYVETERVDVVSSGDRASLHWKAAYEFYNPGSESICIFDVATQMTSETTRSILSTDGPSLAVELYRSANDRRRNSPIKSGSLPFSLPPSQALIGFFDQNLTLTVGGSLVQTESADRAVDWIGPAFLDRLSDGSYHCGREPAGQTTVSTSRGIQTFPFGNTLLVSGCVIFVPNLGQRGAGPR